MNNQGGGGYSGAGPQMKRARKQGVISASTTSISAPPPPPLQSSVSATFECEDDAVSITSTTRMSEECSFEDGVECSDECTMTMQESSSRNISRTAATAVPDAAPAAATASADTSSDVPPPFVPRGFRCPLSSQVMLDPVLDGEGNTYEYSAILDWLKQGHRTSPISHQPLSERMLNPNNSLREAIHEYMGSDWVRNARAHARQQQQQQQQALQQEQPQSNHNSAISNMSSSDNSNNNSMDSSGEQQQQQQQQNHEQQPRSYREIIIAAVADPDQRSRQKIDCFLQFVLLKIDGLKSLSLDEYGCCAFQYDGIMIVIDVPLKTGTFCFYTRNLVPYEPTEAMKDLLLELNFLQEGTRGGCLSVKRVDGIAEVLFSYNDRVANTSAQEFLNIFINFCITSSTVRRKLLAVINFDNNNNNNNVMQIEQQPQQQQQQQEEVAALLSNKCPATTSASTEVTSSLDIVDRKPAAVTTTKKAVPPPTITTITKPAVDEH